MNAFIDLVKAVVVVTLAASLFFGSVIFSLYFIPFMLFVGVVWVVFTVIRESRREEEY